MTWQMIIFVAIMFIASFFFGAIFGMYLQRSEDMKILKEQQDDLREINNRIQEENARLRNEIQSKDDIKIGGF